MQTVEQARESLKYKLGQIWEQPRPSLSDSSGAGIRRLEIPFPKTDLLTWLDNQPQPRKLYWADRTRKQKAAGVGVAFEMNERIADSIIPFFDRINSSLQGSHPGIRYFGGIRFDPSLPASEKWEIFNALRFWVPRFELSEENGQTVFAINFMVPQNGQMENEKALLDKEIDQIRFGDTREVPGNIRVIEKFDIPVFRNWEENVHASLEMFRRDELQKIVLARESCLTLSRRLSPVSLMKKIAAQNGGAYNFLFQFADEIAFLGITPEQLYRREGSNIFSEAVAGTRRRGKNEREDIRFGRELLNSEKDVREHRWVSEMVKETLQELCGKTDAVSAEQLLKLSNVQHLRTLFRGELKENVAEGKILQTFHPTPAVCGSPRNRALKKISELERFDRGWYAGPVGWVGRNASEFAVAIRSALISGNKLSVYAGAGIVTGSEPEAEWQELEDKILNFTNLFDKR